MEETKGQNNARSLFGLKQVPCDVHIRKLLDAVAPSHVLPVFGHVFHALPAAGALSSYLSCFGGLLVDMDGTEYFSSKQLHCQNCSSHQHKNGSTTYFHSVVTPVVVAPGQAKVIALEPEFILPQDGHDKQDCEIAAAPTCRGGWTNTGLAIVPWGSPSWGMTCTVINRCANGF